MLKNGSGIIWTGISFHEFFYRISVSAMDDQPSEGNERVAEIFIVSSDETVTGPLKEDLEKNNHLVCVVSDCAQLKETLPAGKPGLLIVDGSTQGGEGYDFVRGIKADGDLWNIPVLVLTSESTMHGLLKAIESNADNFIAPPYNTPDHLSLIEGMLATPIERPTRDELKKQFRVRQDDQTYVVAAPGRILLEYLLSSFEIVAGKSSDLSSLTSELRKISESARDMERTLIRQTGEIEALKASFLKKEQTITDLTGRHDELEKTLAQKTDEIKNLAAEFENSRTSLDTVENSLNEEEIRSASLEKTIRDLKSELGRQKNVFAGEKNKTLSAEREIAALKEAKAQSERDLNLVISGLNETAQQHADELARLKSELEAETSRRVLAENQAAGRQRESELHGYNFQSETEVLNLQVSKLQETLDASAAALETERGLRQASEVKAKSAIQQKEDLELLARRYHEEMERTNTDQAAMIWQVKEELKVAHQQVQLLEADAGNLTREKIKAEQDVRMLTTELEQARTTLADERKSHPVTGEGSAGKERHLVQQPLISPDEDDPPKETPNLVVLEEPHVPMTVDPIFPPVVTEPIPALEQIPVTKKDLVASEPAVETSRVFSGVIPKVSGDSDVNIIFLQQEPGVKGGNSESVRNVNEPVAKETDPLQRTTNVDDPIAKDIDPAPGQEKVAKAAKEESVPDNEYRSERTSPRTPEILGGPLPGGDISFTRSQWLDLLKWARHTVTLSKDDRLKIVRMGRLVQKDGKLGKKQQDQVREILLSASALGYHPQ